MKKNSIKIYSQALAEIALGTGKERLPAGRQGGPTSAKSKAGEAERFLAVLAKNGLQGKAKEIVALAEDIVLQKQGKQKITLETARQMTAGQKKLLHGIAKDGDKVKEKINSELIAGVKIVINENRQLDLTIKNKLQKIF